MLPVRQRDNRFFSGIALVIAVVVFVGFAPTYYLKSVFGTRELAPLFHLHGFLFSAWIALLVVQTQLVGARTHGAPSAARRRRRRPGGRDGRCGARRGRLPRPGEARRPMRSRVFRRPWCFSSFR